MSAAGPDYDVVIAGSGLGGALLATILARHGQRVLLLESGTHPRFAVGESLVPEFSLRMKILARRFDVPELEQVGSFQELIHGVGSSHGIKRNFSFLWHAPGAEHRARDAVQFLTMTYPLGPDAHVYRADLDAWLVALAVRHGVDYRERTPLGDVDVQPDGVVCRAGDRDVRARLLVDGTGRASKGSRCVDGTMATDSRSIFTHMVGVGGVAQGRADGRAPDLLSPPDQGTLHHVFHGGWLWIIPFGNHARSTNPLTSVGLTLDRRVFPDEGLEAGEEFARIVERFPTMARQLADARPVRSWIKTGRLQVCAPELAGDRRVVLPHAGRFVDPLFSAGLAMTVAGVHQLAAVLLEAVPADDLGAETFRPYVDALDAQGRVVDRIVHGSYLAWRDPDLFNAWYRFWAVGSYHASLGAVRVWLDGRARPDVEGLDAMLRPEYSLLLGAGHPRNEALQAAGYATLQRVDAGELSVEQGTRALFALLAEADFIPPQFRVHDPEHKHVSPFTFGPLMSILHWGRRSAPEDIRSTYYQLDPVFFRELLAAVSRETRRGVGQAWRLLRDIHVSRGSA